LEVTNPENNLFDSPTLTTRIVHPTKNFIYAESTDVTTVFKVVIGISTETSFGTPGESIARVAFGANPMTLTGHLYGAGIYAETYCVGSATYNNAADTPQTATTDLPSNCASKGTTNLNPANEYLAVGPMPARSVNAIELAWTIPRAIPSDTTKAVVECYTDIAFDSGNANYRFFHIQ
jgi:hypothetical protein